jgi:hypothetical protein
MHDFSCTIGTIIAALQERINVDYQIAYRWDFSQARPALLAHVSGSLLADPATIPTIIDQTHTLINEQPHLTAVTLAYDLTRTEGRLPLAALMRRSVVSPAVKQVTIYGARSRTDEMAILIMSAAKRLPYEIVFAASTPDHKPQFFAHQR